MRECNVCSTVILNLEGQSFFSHVTDAGEVITHAIGNDCMTCTACIQQFINANAGDRQVCPCCLDAGNRDTQNIPIWQPRRVQSGAVGWLMGRGAQWDGLAYLLHAFTRYC